MDRGNGWKDRFQRHNGRQSGWRFGAKVGWAANDLGSRLQLYWAGLLKTGRRECRGSRKNKSVPVYFLVKEWG
jgi:hypothetical protein